MYVTSADKEHIQTQIVEIIIYTLEHEQMTNTQASEISEFVLKEISHIHTQDDLMRFLQELSNRWKIFLPLHTQETGKKTEQIEEEVAEGVLLLTQHGKIDEALKLARSATQ